MRKNVLGVLIVLQTRREISFLMGVIIALSGLVLIYSTGLNNELVFDDILAFPSPEVLRADIDFSWGYRSLWIASYQVVHQMLGVDIFWQRAVNLMLHLVNAILLFIFSYRLVLDACRDSREGSVEIPVERRTLIRWAVLVGVVAWALNPVAVYAVAYLTQRSILMATGFGLVALIAFSVYLGTRSGYGRYFWLILSVFAYALALMSKEHAAPILGLFPLIYVYLRRPPLNRIALGGIVCIVAGCLAAYFLISQKGFALGSVSEDMVAAHLAELKVMRPDIEGSYYLLSVVNQFWLFFRYAFYWIVPWTGWLSIDMRVPFPLSWFSFPHVIGLFAFPALILIAGWLLMCRRGLQSLVGLMALSCIVLFLPELATARIQEPFVLYRSYLWFIAFPALIAASLLFFINRVSILLLWGVVIGVVFGVLALDRVDVFRGELSVWQDAFNKLNLNERGGRTGLWRAPLNLSDAAHRRRNFEMMYRYADIADRLGAPSGMAKSNMASALLAVGRPAESYALLLKAEAEGFSGRQALMAKGSVLSAMRKHEEAITHFQSALALGLDREATKQVLFQLGRVAGMAGRNDVAVKSYRDLLSLDPDNVGATIGLAYVLNKMGESGSALDLLSGHVERLGGRPEILHARATIYFQLKRLDEARADVQRGLGLEPGNPFLLQLNKQLTEQK